MSKVINAALVLGAALLAPGVEAGLFRVILTDSAGNEVARKEVADPSVTFEAVPAGEFTVTALRLDAHGAAISDPVHASISVPADQVSVDVPVSITLSLA
ncbi:MAG: hypothetical protein KGL90_15515 [Burkholderiales bacterium]|nr:hypothetical protein [Burkholderiales bacterium]